ncbi:hypothetical protein GM921_00770 [Pedobacter sp. LMG 31464]|uniref:Uncharacterized protein n=1 Tax=Pedobacter planticolens TaxID=2679964 RepID=A0A923DWZ9_9SPHI|nr:hypothetical protein [Pedobacter planticolens]MBB2144003.1 hypothetical protein [Pedobacter planticolens]
MKKTILITIALGFILFTAIFIYFVSGVSSVSPPIKKYQYFGSVNQLLSGFEKYSSNHSDMTFKITDTVGGIENGYAYYMTIEIMNNKHNITYRIMCEQNKDDKNIKTNVNLILAFDETNKTGGYQMKGKVVEVLVKQFDLGVLKPLKDKQNIQINPL